MPIKRFRKNKNQRNAFAMTYLMIFETSETKLHNKKTVENYNTRSTRKMIQLLKFCLRNRKKNTEPMLYFATTRKKISEFSSIYKEKENRAQKGILRVSAY